MGKCREITEKIEQLKFEDLGFWGRFKVKLHLLMCKACQNYLKDSNAIDRFIHAQQEKIIAKYSPEEKQELLNQLP